MKKLIYCLQVILLAAWILFVPLRGAAQSLASAHKAPGGLLQGKKSMKSLSALLGDLEKKYKVTFSFDRNTIKDKKVGLYSQRFTVLEDELHYVLQPLQLTFEKVGDRIYLILTEKKQVAWAETAPLAQPSPEIAIISENGQADAEKTVHGINDEIRINGRVIASGGEGLPNVNVVYKGSSIGTTTDMNGGFSLDIPDRKGTLVFTLVGYNSREVQIGNESVINITMDAEFKTIGEVVVVGYGTQRKKDLTGSVATINGKDLNKMAVASVDQALQGKLPGVLVTTNSGEPGGGMTVRVRGIGGFGNSEPLYVIDGVIITYNSSDAATNPLATLNMSDIESLNVLKDASACAIYGARAGNGVVLITTKRGKTGKARINGEMYYGVQSIAHKIDMMNAKEFAAFSNESRINGNSPVYDEFANPESLGEGTDWQDQIFQKAPMSNYQLSISGGGDKNQYFISGGYQKQDGVIKGSAFDRYSLRTNLDNQILPWLKMGTSLNLSRTGSNSLTSVNNNDKYDGVVAIALRRSPTLGVYNPDGSWAGTPAAGNNFLGQIPNPLRIATELYNPIERIRGLGNLYFDIRLMRDLVFRTSLGIDYVLSNSNGFQKLVTEESVADLSRSAYASKGTNSNILSENTLNYKHIFGKKHNVDALVGYTAQKSTYESVYAFSENHLNDVLTTVDAGSSIGRLASGNKTVTSYLSFLGRINYAYDNKYLVTANIRRDGASVFSAANKYAVFPSFSAGWRLSNENFFAPVRIVSNFMLRGSWGQTGIDGSLGVGAEYANMGTGYLYNFGGVPVNGMVQNSIANSALRWETVTQTDLGFDLGLLDNRVNVTVDYFRKEYSDMIEQRPVPSYFGIWDGPWAGGSITMPTNGATVENKGFEFAVNYENQSLKGDFRYSLGVNLTTFSNKVTNLKSPTMGGPAGVNTSQGNLTRTEEGHSVGEFYGFIVDGIFQNQDEVDKAEAVASANTAPGDYRFRDVNGDKKIDDKDKTFIGSPIPDYMYGIVGDLSYKQFDLNFSFQGVAGNQIVNVNKFITEATSGVENKSKTMLNRWTPQNPSSQYARAIYNDPNGNDRFSTRHVEDGSFFRLRSLQLGYKLPSALINRISLSMVRVYVSAQNVFTITKYSGYNPDIGSQKQSNASSGLDNTIYPQSRSIVGGIQVSF
ncbi:SusC/RagA family TonB-linked outer membrane protein [Flavihumibacter petaseus]|uniref:Putative TonB-dependent receptor n=1 Tax=Flavihumibacter petaseus NBRC 106054 TaxID=1220578 RepID=A0A0E9MVK6_9BACT|nr:TonB-dependent receptor [Flavihumibacter petaseus]GAO41518.1 putative TonB-dependent receptor [Flavihumibacter petaseus NBRC 106054]